MKNHTRKHIIPALTALMAASALAGCAQQSAGAVTTAAAGKTSDAGNSGETNDTAAETLSTESWTAGTNDSNTGVDIVNDYNNTDELLKKFPVEYQTPVRTDLEKSIQNRLLTGFENWNRGFDAWKAWGDILYTQDSIYNVHGVRMTLPEYQASMNVTLQQMDIQMGAFHNMLITDDWAAIYYDIATTDPQTQNTYDGNVMEFVQFKDYGKDVGTRVVEGWGSVRDQSYDGMLNFLPSDEQDAQNTAWQNVVDYTVPHEKPMPYKPMVPCRHPGCAELVEPGQRYCEKHKKMHPEENRSAAARGYNSCWRRESKKFLELHPLCEECLKQGIATPATVVDHIVPHRGDPKLFWDRSNWQALCKRCHDRKTRREDSNPTYRY